jgi:hypothetical protein
MQVPRKTVPHICSPARLAAVATLAEFNKQCTFTELRTAVNAVRQLAELLPPRVWR